MDFTRFEVAIDESQIDDLQRRLARTRWPQPYDIVTWHDGSSLAFMQRLVAHWRTDFDWRRQEARLNQLPQFRVTLDDLTVHFVHQRGVGPAPFPLIMTHGWPGSFAEMEKIIPLLADPAAHGADPTDAFDIVVPSLPGYGFSQAPAASGYNSSRIADLWSELMHGVISKKLGRRRYND